MPTADEFFGTTTASPPPPPPLPTAAQFFGLDKPQAGTGADTFWSNVANAGTKVLNAVGFGASDAWGSKPLGIDPETATHLRKVGDWNDYQNGENNFFKTASEAVIRPAVQIADLLGRAPGAALAGIEAGAEQLRAETDVPNANLAQQALRLGVATPIGAGATYLQQGGGAEFGFGAPLEATALSVGRNAAVAEARVSAAQAARSVGAVGEGEAGFYDAKPLTPEAATARTEAAQEAGVEPSPAQAPPPDVHALARRIDPETFAEYDALNAESALHRDAISKLGAERAASPEALEAQEQITTILGRVNNVPSRLTQAAAGRLAAAQERLDAILHAETPEMAEARSQLMDADYRMRELAPDVSAAYRYARELAPELPETAAVAEAQGAKAAEAEREGVPPAAAAEVAETQPTTAPEQTVAAAGASPEAQAEVAPPNVVSETTVQGSPETQQLFRDRLSQARYGNLRAAQGTGETVTRGLAAHVEESAIEQGLAENFGDLPEYQRLSMADQAAQAARLIADDYETAKDVAMGVRQPPRGLLPESVFVGVEKRALAEGDVDTLRALATRSRLTTAATTMGQRIRTLGERDPTSPVGAIQAVQQARMAALKDAAEQTKAVITDIKAAMRDTATKPDAWSAFVDSLKCDS